jgi:hypothetical protein
LWDATVSGKDEDERPDAVTMKEREVRKEVNYRLELKVRGAIKKVLSLTYLYARQINEHTFTFQHSHHLIVNA